MLKLRAKFICANYVEMSLFIPQYLIWLPTVPNNSFGFWADLHLDGHVSGMAGIHKY